VVGVCDINGNSEIIAYKKAVGGDTEYILCRLKPVQPESGKWEIHEISNGLDAVPLTAIMAPLSSGERSALIVTYVKGKGKIKFPDIIAIPSDPSDGPWQRKVFAEIPVTGDIILCDITGNGTQDVIIGSYWFENKSDGGFIPHRYAPEGYEAAGLAVMDVNGDGRPDIILGEDRLDPEKRIAGWSRLSWFENPADPKAGPWEMHVLDWVRCAFSVGVGDLDNNGIDEIYCGEHDPFYPYRNKSRLIGYKMVPFGSCADPRSGHWNKYVIDDRFEHYRGARIFGSGENKYIASQGLSEELHLNIWKPVN